jgi:hypothetical protein
MNLSPANMVPAKLMMDSDINKLMVKKDFSLKSGFWHTKADNDNNDELNNANQNNALNLRLIVQHAGVKYHKMFIEFPWLLVL